MSGLIITRKVFWLLSYEIWFDIITKMNIFSFLYLACHYETVLSAMRIFSGADNLEKNMKSWLCEF